MVRILVLGANPAWQKNATCTGLRTGSVVRMRTAEGGAAGKGFNCALALGRLGRPAVLISGIGTDGDAWEQACREEGIALRGFPLSGPVRRATTLRDLETEEVTELVEEGPPAAEGAQRAVEEALGSDRSASVCCCGTLAQGLDADRILASLSAWTENVIIDSVPLVRAAISGGAVPERLVLKLSGAEWTDLCGPDPESSLAMVRAVLPRAFLVATVGSRGSLAVPPDGPLFRVPAPAIAADVRVHPIGAGDAYTAGMAAALAGGLEFPDACRWGAAAARASCLDPLPSRFSRRDFEESLKLVQDA
ncbi:MAG TPA: PfkB family carbohydrate kinase [Fibrobacteria bacterium]|nr:PfkB family carbohydrate kinase [Fibrobacteria bacterium]